MGRSDEYGRSLLAHLDRNIGPGNPSDERNLLFLDGEVDRLHPGSGLALLFAYRVVKVSGGELGIIDNDLTGAVIEITLPGEGPDT